MKVLVTGATGFIGRVLVDQLLKQGHEVVILTRSVAQAAIVLGNKCHYFQWSDISVLPPLEAFEGVEGVVNLMGEDISQKWNDEVKQEIYRSRVLGTRNLVKAFSKLTLRPKVFISNSAVGVYGDRGGEEITENSSLGDDFLAHVCKNWEAEAMKGADHGQRVVVVRVGVVLGPYGGALKRMLPIYKLGLGSKAGTGDQYMSWIHVNDLAAMYVEVLRNECIEGVINGTAPYPTTNAYFSRLLGKALKRPTFTLAPAPVLKFVFGEMSSVMLQGQKVLPKKMYDETNFRFHYPTIEIALKESIRN